LRVGLDGSLDDVEPAAQGVADVHRDDVAHVAVPVAQVGDPVNSQKVDEGASGRRGGEEGVHDGREGIEIGEAALFVGEGLRLSVADDVDGEVVDILVLSSIRGHAGDGGFRGSGCGDEAGVRPDGHLVLGSIGAESYSGDVDGGSAADAARGADDLRRRR